MVLRRRDAEMGVDDPSEFVRRLNAGQENARRPGGNRDDRGVIASENNRPRLEFERDGAVGSEANLAQAVA